ncbi:hypothetical protein AAFF_G00069060 [Aldrovandia affinis]|uniref:Uncharacterized protein n=1 Tax=Aldrovandia affinis TaxID=143900 RepID=A0AAD7RZ06_9TELE|nr:hypothetical protein AAFF_G00069060 [Aldrovandia affinis]
MTPIYPQPCMKRSTLDTWAGRREGAALCSRIGDAEELSREKHLGRRSTGLGFDPFMSTSAGVAEPCVTGCVKQCPPSAGPQDLFLSNYLTPCIVPDDQGSALSCISGTSPQRLVSSPPPPFR